MIDSKEATAREIRRRRRVHEGLEEAFVAAGTNSMLASTKKERDDFQEIVAIIEEAILKVSIY